MCVQVLKWYRCSVVLEQYYNVSKYWYFMTVKDVTVFREAGWVVWQRQVSSWDPTWSQNTTRRTARFRWWILCYSCHSTKNLQSCLCTKISNQMGLDIFNYDVSYEICSHSEWHRITQSAVQWRPSVVERGEVGPVDSKWYRWWRDYVLALSFNLCPFVT